MAESRRSDDVRAQHDALGEMPGVRVVERDAPEFEAGQELTWVYVPRGGYGFPINVPVKVIRVAQKRVRVEAPLARGGTKEVWVWPRNLYARGA